MKLLFVFLLISASHYGYAQSLPPVGQMPAIQRQIDSLYQEQEEELKRVALAKVDSVRLRYQAVHLATIVRQQSDLMNLLTRVGFPDGNKVGRISSIRYVTLVGRGVQEPKFQQLVLRRMKPLVGADADATAFAILTDQTELASGRAQIYGTQLMYQGNESGRQVRQPLADPGKVDKRRSTIGLPPLQAYIAAQSTKYQPSNVPKKTN